MKVLAIETSCDDTAGAVVEDGRKVLSSIVSSQIDLHAHFGGVVPEVASRAHLDLVVPVVNEALKVANCDVTDIDLVAATSGPGLVGSLLVGVSAAKAYALAWSKPFIGINHMEGHLHAAFLEDPELALPSIVLLVSGGHTQLVLMSAPGVYSLIGETIDDAAGEAYDKVARFMGLGYPGGPPVDRLAQEGNPEAIKFPRALSGQGYDFSFSGLKTSVVNYLKKNPDADQKDVAAGFQAAVVDVLVEKASKAAVDLKAKSIAIGGGVAANSSLRDAIVKAGADLGIRAFLPSRSMCTDNAAMVGATAWYRFGVDGATALGVGVDPNMSLPFVPVAL